MKTDESEELTVFQKKVIKILISYFSGENAVKEHVFKDGLRAEASVLLDALKSIHSRGTYSLADKDRLNELRETFIIRLKKDYNITIMNYGK